MPNINRGKWDISVVSCIVLDTVRYDANNVWCAFLVNPARIIALPDVVVIVG